MADIDSGCARLAQAVSGVLRLSGRCKLRWSLRPRRRISALLLVLLAGYIPAFLPQARALDLNALPSGGTVKVGTAAISQSGNQLTVQQGSKQLGIDWQSFNIGANATVNFLQPGASSIALNRIVGNDPSQIFGHLTANGQVFLSNPNGVLFAPGAKADVGGLVASTLDLSQSDFASGNYRFNSTGSGASVLNQGSLHAASGGYIALFGSNVANQGQIDAPTGSVLLASGSAVTVGIDPNGLFSAVVTPATAAAWVSNSGSISADGGSVRLDAQAAQGIAESLVNNSGIIRAQSIENRNGDIYLTGAQTVDNTGTLDVSASGQGTGGSIVLKADMQSGTANVGGTLLARGGALGGDGGSVETSGAHAHMAADLQVDATAPKGKTGQWLIDPNDYVIAASGGDITGAVLGANLLTANVTLDSSNGTVVTSTGHGDISVNDNVSWLGANTLTLNAYRNINVNASISNSAGAQLVLRSDDSGSGSGSVVFGASGAVNMGSSGRADLYYNPVSYSAPSNFSANLGASSNWTAWMLVNDVGVASGGTHGLQAINTNLAGSYALGKDIDASGSAAWNSGAGFAPIGSSGSPFTGKLDGLGHSISGLSISRSSTSNVGLFSDLNGSSAVLENLNLSGGSVLGYSNVGALLGYLNLGSVVNVSSALAVTGSSSVGGLVGQNSGAISNSSSSGAVTGSNAASSIGGLVGYNTGSISQSYASGVVNGGSNSYYLGGLAGYSGYGAISASYATGAVTGAGSSSYIGGLVGYAYSGSVANSYASNAVVGASSVASVFGVNYGVTISNVYSNIDHSSVNGQTVYDANAFDSAQIQEKIQNAGVLNIANYASLAYDASSGAYVISNLQGMKDLLGFVGNAQYKFALGASVDLASVPGYYIPSFSAQSFDGRGNTINHLNVALAGSDNIGFIGVLASGSTLSNLVLSNVSVSGRNDVGAAVGNVTAASSASTVLSNVSVTGTGSITAAGQYAGGLVGQLNSYAGISGSSAVANVSGNYYVGGLAGYSSSSTITGSSASGNVSGISYVGGLLGVAYSGTVSNSYATGAVTGSGNALGGLMGYSSSSTLSHVYATGAVTGSGTSVQVGGLVGESYYGSISNAWSSGAVIGNSNVGPVVGYVYGTTLSNIIYDLDNSKVNGNAVYGPYGLEHAQLLEMVSSGTLNIQNYSSLVYDAASQSYVISSVQGLKDLLGFAGSSYSFSLGADLDLSGMAGFYVPSFTAHSFDGKGHSISNLSLSPSLNPGSGNDLALFGVLGSNSSVRNLSLLNVNVSGSSYVGALVGEVLAPSSATSVISNITLSGSVTGSGNYIGGAVGSMDGAAGMDHVVSSVSVAGGSYYLGGLIGYNASGTLTASSASGTVSGSASYMGGLVGYNSGGTVSASNASGAVTGANYSQYLGGLVGYGYGPLSNVSASGNVSAGNYASYLGGLLGSGGGSVSTAYATGTVSAGSAANYLGGLIGNQSGYSSTVTSAYATGAVSGAANSSYLGGLIGYNSAPLVSVYATGVVNGSSTGNYVGGLVGSNSGSVSNSYASGAVTGLGNTAALFGSNTATAISNVFYDIDSSTVNGNPVVGPYGIYDNEFQDWSSHGLVLNIANYASTLPYDSASGSYGISSIQGLKDVLGFAGVSAYSFKLTAATLDLSTLPGYYIPVFSAHSFDGNGNTIANLNVNQPNVSNLGFIGTLGAASTLQNLNLSNVSIVGASVLGGAVGNALSPSGTVTMFSHVTVSGSVVGSGSDIGGLLGYNNGAGAISQSSANVNVQGTNDVGGLVGLNYYGAIANSFAVGAVSANTASNTTQAYFGGLVGQSYGALSNVYATGAVTVATAASSGVTANYVGGLAGYSSGTLSSVYATGAVSAGTGSGNSANDIGGLVGQSNSSVSNSYASGNVAVGATGSYAAGLLGYNSGAVSNAHASGAVSGSGSFAYLGGLIGYNYGNLSGVYATGSVTSSGGNGSYVGGLAGSNSGSVTNSYASGAVSGASYTAALFGANSSTSISNVYYDIDTSTVNAASLVGPYGIYDGQFQDWISHSLSLNISNYAASLPYNSSLGAYAISGLQGMKDLLGFAGVSQYSFALTQSLDLSALPGYYIPVFTAHQFNGGGNTLSHLNLNQPNTNNLGFIGTLGANSLLSNLTLSNASVSGGANLGVAVGNVLAPSGAAVMLSNVSVSGAVLGSGNDVGGVVGQVNGAAGMTAVSSSATVQGAAYVGGLAGSVGNGAISNSFASGSVTGGASGNYIGGLLGNAASATLTADYASGSVSAGSSAYYVGGLLGYGSYTALNNVYATGAVTALGSSSDVGGLAGYLYSGSVANSHAAGTVNAGSSGNSVGGLIGQSSYTPVTGSYALGAVTGNYYVGGLLGDSSSSIAGSFAMGAATGYYYVGGLVGTQQSYAVSNSYASGAAAASGAYAGGLIGYASYAPLSAVYSTGAVTAGSGRGGLVGYFSGSASITASYWDTSASGTATSAAGTGLTTAQMKAQANFSGWDFASTWMLYEGNTYPMLQAFLKPLTVSAGTFSKSYDQQVYAGALTTLVYSDPTALGQLQGTLQISSAAPTAVNAGSYAITPSGLWSNSQFGYNISYLPGSLTITPLSVTVSGLTAADKVYDGSRTATINGGVLDTSNVLAGDVVSVLGMLGTFSDKNVGNGKTVSVAIGTQLGGAAGVNYVVSNASSMSASITPKALSVTAVSVSNKVYDGSIAATLSGGALQGVVNGDSVSLSGLTGNFSDKNVGSAKTVTIAGGVLAGSDSSNYQISSIFSGTLSADITPRAITSSGITALDKVYDQTTSASLSLANAVLHGQVQGDAVGLDASTLTGTFADKNVGSAKLVSVSGVSLSGSDAANYTITDLSNVTASITPKAVSISAAVAYDRVYNGNRIAAISGAVANGVISGDSINTASLVGQFDSKDVGSGKSVSILPGSTLAGTDGANYVVTSANAMTASVTPFVLHVTSAGVASKVYDGTTLASVTGGQLLGVLGTDAVSLTSLSGHFVDKNVGTAKTVNLSGGALVGADAGDYQLASSIALTGSADITPRALVVSGISAQDKVYDRSTNATLNTSGWVLSGLVPGDAVSMDPGSASGSFANKNVGQNKTVTISGLLLSGSDALNYTVSDPGGALASITPAPVSLSGYSANSKVYDGSRSATASGGSASGVIQGDSVSTSVVAGLFDSKSAGSGKTVSVLGSALAGADGGNYVVVSSNALTADITPRVLVTSTITAQDKVYDGTTLASLSGGNLSNVVYGDDVSLTAISGTFADKNVGLAKVVTISGGALVGSDSGNYVLPAQLSGSTTASIVARQINSTGITAQSKVYDQLTSAQINTTGATLNGVLGADSVTLDLSAAVGNFADKNVGSGKLVSISGMALLGAGAGNYLLVDASNATAAITPVSVSLSGFSAASKIYDGTRNAVVSGGTIQGVLLGDSVSNSLNGLFDSRNVGLGKSVTVLGASLGGSDGGNYVVASANPLSADISPKTLSVSTITVNSKVYDGSVQASISGGLLSGVLGSDNVALTAVSASFADKNVGNAKVVSLSGGALTGADAGNYQLAGPVASSALANITPLAITVSGITAADMQYNGSRVASIDTAGVVLSGVIGADNVTLNLQAVSGSFADKNVGVAKPVTVSGLSLLGSDAMDYSVSDASQATASISPRGVTLSGYSASSKVYDGSRSALVSGGSLLGVLQGDSVASTITGQFDSKNVGTGKTVTVLGSALGGSDGGNYVITSANPLSADITPKSLTVSSVSIANKVYDGTLAATLSGGILSGVVQGDSVDLSALTASFADKNVGQGKLVNISGGALGGADVSNYVLVGSLPSTALANITPLALSASGITAQDKTYDRSTSATLVSAGAALSGVIGGDSVVLDLSAMQGSFANKNVGVAKPVTITGLALSGTDAGNYSVSDPGGASATISPLGVTITGASAASKVYDGSRAAAISGAVVSGVLPGDVVTTAALSGLFSDKNVGTGKTVSLSGLALLGADGGNYVIDGANAVTADITPKALSISAVTASNKVYDGSLVATLSGGALSGVVYGDVVNLSALSGSFADKNVGNYKTVSISGGSLTGADAGNYQLSSSIPSTASASITPLTLTVSGVTAQDKVYDQSSSASINVSAISLNGVIGSDAVVLNAGSVQGSFADKNVGTAKPVYLSGLSLSGGDAQNYLVSNVSGASASITPKPVTLSGYSAADKIYDGTLSATITGGTATGIYSGDLVSTSVLTGVFDSKDVGNNKTVTLNGVTLGGADGANYVISSAAPVYASIAPKVLSVGSFTASDKVYDGTVQASVSAGSLIGVVGSDNVTLTSVNAVFSDKNVGVGKTVTVNGGSLSGSDAGNYLLAGSVSGSTTASITPLALSSTGILALDKVYDRTTAASLDTSAALLQGVLSGDSVQLNVAGAVGSFGDRNVGIGKAVAVSGLSLSGGDAGNYSVSDASGASASITPKAVTISGATAQNKVYDGNTSATIVGGAVSGVISGDVVTSSALIGQFDSKNAGLGKSVTLSGGALGGPDGANYAIGGSFSLSANITPKTLTVTGASAQDKVYDGGVSVSITGGILSGVVQGDSVAVSGVSGSFADKNVGVGKSIVFSGGSLSGADAGNYVLPGAVSGTTTASITPLAITATGFSALNKVYDDTVLATLVGSSATLTGVLGSDSVSLVSSAAQGSFANKNAGVGKSVSITGLSLSGADASNYSVSDASAATASITPKPVTLSSVSASNKVYDGSTTASLSGAVLNGIYGGDVVSVAALSGSFDTRNVGTGKAVALDSAQLGGADAGNYSVASANAMAADITPKALTISGITAANKVYDGGTLASVSTAGVLESGLVNGDVVQVSASGQFADKNVANGKSVALSSSYSGADVGNYSITDQATASANVTPKALTISGITAANKVYDATTLASVSTAGVLESGLVNGDVVHVAATGQFSDPNAATGKTVLLSSSYSGADAGNYSITSQATTSANVTPRTLTIAAGTVVVPADKLASATVDVAVVAGALVGSDQLAALVAPALDQNALAGAVQPLVPPDPVFTQGLASNYNVVKVNGYQIVLPSQAAALNSSSGSGSTPNVFYLQLNQGEIDSATQTLDQLHSTLPRTQTAPLPVEDSLAPGSSPARTWSTDALTRQAAQYLQEIKESTPAVLQNLRSQPLLLWDAQPAGSGVDLSDNGTSH